MSNYWEGWGGRQTELTYELIGVRLLTHLAGTVPAPLACVCLYVCACVCVRVMFIGWS